MAKSFLDITEHSSLITSFILLISLPIIMLLLVKPPIITFDQVLIIWLTIVLISFTHYAVYTEQLQHKNEENIRLVEKRLEYFYRPLKTLFICYKGTPIECYENKTDEFYKIGCYRHLAKKDTFCYYEKCTGCIPTNDTILKLLDQIAKDIDALQKEYTELKS